MPDNTGNENWGLPGGKALPDRIPANTEGINDSSKNNYMLKSLGLLKDSFNISSHRTLWRGKKTL